ncbi:hypothetical protein RCL_jg15324.t1 [Rhizophagus clarus]|uniref:Uncharacterized protein n=1 Tax=Rhizophagus clarus TaxID=94130 RepID=A0A8H3KN21_9GLOM|nr:hypothetical protein RCL_jg15324.t1 [Rhizophagus clarus]
MLNIVWGGELSSVALVGMLFLPQRGEGFSNFTADHGWKIWNLIHNDEVQRIYKPANENNPRHGGSVFWGHI